MNENPSIINISQIIDFSTLIHKLKLSIQTDSALIKLDNELYYFKISKYSESNISSSLYNKQDSLKDQIETIESNDSIVKQLSGDKDDHQKSTCTQINIPNLKNPKNFTRKYSNEEIFKNKSEIASFETKSCFSSSPNKQKEINKGPLCLNSKTKSVEKINYSQESMLKLTAKKSSQTQSSALNLNKTASFNTQNQDNDEFYKENEFEKNMFYNNEKKMIPTTHDSCNTIDFNLSKTDSKNESPIRMNSTNKGNLIMIENQEESKFIEPFNQRCSIDYSMNIDNLENTKSILIASNSKLEQDSYEDIRYSGGSHKKSLSTRYEVANETGSINSFLDFEGLNQSISEFFEKNIDKNDEKYSKIKDFFNLKIQELKKIELKLNEKNKYLKQLELDLKEKELKFPESEQSDTYLGGKDYLGEFLEEKFDFTNRKKAYSIPDDSKIHFMFLYSSPLITYYKDSEGRHGKRPIFNEINYEKDLKNIKEIFSEQQKDIKFISLPAILDNFSLTLDKNPIAIHFCGHGVQNTEETFGISYNIREGNYLIFEKQDGAADFISTLDLSNQLAKIKNPLYFAFVASCHSKLVGEVFLNAGALHVICVKDEERILDSACQIFTKSFYNSCINGKKTICEAFQIAKDQVKAEKSIPKGEENKFILLKKDDENLNYFEDHECMGWIDAGKGRFVDLSPICEYDHLPSKIDCFVGRNEIIHDLILLILENRLITVKGIAGIGKSSLVKQTIHYLYERNHFKNGIIYLNLNACETKEAVVSCLSTRVLGKNQHLDSSNENLNKMIDEIFETLHLKIVLIVFDNLELIYNEKNKFLLFLKNILSNCGSIKILITSKNSMSEGINLHDYAEKIISLGPLNPEDSKNLLLLRSPRPIEETEIQELLNAKSISHLNKNKDFSQHDFFKFFGGHPQAIVLAASLLDSKTLKESYQYLQKHSIFKDFDYGNEMTDQEKKMFNSLKISLDVSWDCLSHKFDDSAKMLACIGLLPAGISEDEFKFFWKENWKENCDILLRNSFLRKSKNENGIHYGLFPFMTKYAEEHLSLEEKKEFNEKIIDFYSKKLKEMYKQVFTISIQAETHLNSFLKYELNIRACIFRELSYQCGECNLEKSLYNSFDIRNYSIFKESNLQISRKKSESPGKDVSFSAISLNSSFNRLPTENLANQLTTPRNSFYNNFIHSPSLGFSSFTECISNDAYNSESIEIKNVGKNKTNKYNKDDNISKSNESPHLFNKEIKETPKFTKDTLCEYEDSRMEEGKTIISNFSNVKTSPSQNNNNNKKMIKPSVSFDPSLIFKNSNIQKKKDIFKEFDQNNYKENNSRKKGGDNYELISEKINEMIIYYITIMILMRRIEESEKFLRHGKKLADGLDDKLMIANYIRIEGTIEVIIKKNYANARECFLKASSIFISENCSLGLAICKAALGYLAFLEKNYFDADNYLKSGVILYENLDHVLGCYFLNHWLAKINQKLKRQADSSLYNSKCMRIMAKEKTEIINHPHKGGLFVLRGKGKGDVFSLFLETAFTRDENSIPIKKLKKKNPSPPQQKEKNLAINYKFTKEKDNSNNDIQDLSKKLGAPMEESQEFEDVTYPNRNSEEKIQDPLNGNKKNEKKPPLNFKNFGMKI